MALGARAPLPAPRTAGNLPAGKGPQGFESPNVPFLRLEFAHFPDQKETFVLYMSDMIALLALLLLPEKPPALSGHSMSYSKKLGGVLLMNGDSDPSYVWLRNGTKWSRVEGSQSAPRSLAAVAYDADHDFILVQGGATAKKNASGQLDWTVTSDTLTFDVKAWKTLSTVGPPPRDHNAMAYDRARKRFVMFGGSDSDPSGRTKLYGDTWEWDGTRWTQMATTGPGARCHHAMAYDEVLHKVILVGGFGTTGPDPNTWAWDGAKWSVVATGGPATRSSPRLASDGHSVILFGGDTDRVAASDTWSWNGAEWKQIAKTGPKGRTVHAMAYDAGRGVIVMYGGDSGGVLDDLWEFKGGKWERIEVVK